MAKKYKLNKSRLFLIIGILFLMSLMPGQGEKAPNQQAIKAYDQYPCVTNADCPICVGSGVMDYNASDPNLISELSYSGCKDGVCQMSELCLIWDCGSAQENCDSIKQTVLDNTLMKFNDNPILLLGALIFIIAFVML